MHSDLIHRQRDGVRWGGVRLGGGVGRGGRNVCSQCDNSAREVEPNVEQLSARYAELAGHDCYVQDVKLMYVNNPQTTVNLYIIRRCKSRRRPIKEAIIVQANSLR